MQSSRLQVGQGFGEKSGYVTYDLLKGVPVNAWKVPLKIKLVHVRVHLVKMKLNPFLVSK